MPDGYTLLVCSNGEITLAPYVQEQLPYDPIKELAPIVLVASAPQVIVVHPSVPAKDMHELIAYGRTKGTLGYGTPGFGSSAHVGFELIRTEQNWPFFHVPYKGGGPAVSDLLGGQLQMAVVTIPAIGAAIEGGLARSIAILGPDRSPLLPTVPSLKEVMGLEMRDASSWFALMAPAGTPPDILARLEKAALAGTQARGEGPLGQGPAGRRRHPGRAVRGKVAGGERGQCRGHSADRVQAAVACS